MVAAAEVIEIVHSVGGSGKSTGDRGRHPRGLSPPDTSRSCHTDDCKDDMDHRPTDGAQDQHSTRGRRFWAPRTGKCREGETAKAGKQLSGKLKISKEEHDRAVSNRLCFNCKKPGHFANECPETRMVSGGSGSKPPGKVSSYSIWVALDIERLRDLADTMERVDQLQLGSCQLMLETFMIDELDKWRQRMGNPLARRVEHVLAISLPFTGDNVNDRRTFQRDQFSVCQVNQTQYIIHDSAKDKEDGNINKLLVTGKLSPTDW